MKNKKINKKINFNELLGNNLKQIRENKGLTIDQFSALLNEDRQTYYNYERGLRSLPNYKLVKYIKSLNLSPKDVLKVLNITELFPKTKFSIPSIPVVPVSDETAVDQSKYQTVPVYSFAGAGKFIDLTEIEPIDTLLVPNEFYRKQLSIVKVMGPSMEPYIKDGAYVAIDLDYRELISGYIYCVNLDYEGVLIKYVIKNREGVTLKSENPKFDDIFIKKEEINDSDHFVIGRVVWVWQNI